MGKFRTPRHSFYSRCWLFPAARPGETLLPRQIIPLGAAGAARIIQALSAQRPVRPRAFPDQEFHCSQGRTQQSQPRQSLHQDWVFDQDSRQSLSNSADRFLRHLISFHQLPHSRATQFLWLSARRTRWRSRDLPTCHFRTFHEQERCHGRSQQAETCWLTTLSCQCRWKKGTLSLKIQHWSSSAIITGRSRRMWNRAFLPAKQVPFYTLTSILSWTRENLSITALRGLYLHPLFKDQPPPRHCTFAAECVHSGKQWRRNFSICGAASIAKTTEFCILPHQTETPDTNTTALHFASLREPCTVLKSNNHTDKYSWEKRGKKDEENS